MSQERQYERLMEMDSCGVTRVDVRDLSVTDIVVVEFDSLEVLDRCADLDVLNAVGLEVRKNIKRIVHIHRQNDIQTTQSDSTIIQVKDSLKSNEIVQNKSSPDKASQAIFSTTTIIIMLIIILALIFFIKFTFR